MVQFGEPIDVVLGCAITDGSDTAGHCAGYCAFADDMKRRCGIFLSENSLQLTIGHPSSGLDRRRQAEGR